MNPSTTAMQPPRPLVHDIRPPMPQAPPPPPKPQPPAPAIVGNIPVRQPGQMPVAGPAPQVIGNPIIDGRPEAVDNELDLILKDVSEHVKASDQPSAKKGLFSWLKFKAPAAGAAPAASQQTLAAILGCASIICLVVGAIMTF